MSEENYLIKYGSNFNHSVLATWYGRTKGQNDWLAIDRVSKFSGTIICSDLLS